jgi:hypothetical protein
VAREIRKTDDGFVERLQEKYDQTQRLDQHVVALEALVQDDRRKHAEEILQIDKDRRKVADTRDRLQKQVGELEQQVASLQTGREALLARLEKYEPAKPADPAAPDGTKGAGGATDRSIWWYVIGGVLAAVVVIGGVWWGGMLLSEKQDDGDEQPLTKDNEEKAGDRRKDDAAPPTPDT